MEPEDLYCQENLQIEDPFSESFHQDHYILQSNPKGILVSEPYASQPSRGKQTPGLLNIEHSYTKTTKLRRLSGTLTSLENSIILNLEPSQILETEPQLPVEEIVISGLKGTAGCSKPGRKRKSNTTSKGTKRSKTGLEDVTALYEDDDDDHVLCGICNSWDPPAEEDRTAGTTEWVGCDCDRYSKVIHRHSKRLFTMI